MKDRSTSFPMLEDGSGVTALLVGGFILGLFYFLGQRFATYAQRRKIISSHGCKSPSRFPVWDPVFGLDVMCKTVQAHNRKTYLSTKRSHHEVYGMTHSSRIGTVPTISTIEPENIKAVLSTNFKDFAIGTPRRQAFSPIIANSILVADGVKWEHSRTFLKPCFSRSQIGDLETLETHVKNLIETIPHDGSTMDIAELFLRYTADVTTDLMFGESILSLPHPEVFGSDLMKACRDVQFGAERRFLLGKLANLMPQREFYRSVEKIHAYVDSHVEKAIQERLFQENNETDNVEENGKHVFLKELAKLTDDRLILRDQLLGIFFAGRDTTAALLANLFFVLARNPEVWQRLHEETTSLEGRRPTINELKRLKYLSFCLNESQTLTSFPAFKFCWYAIVAALRLYPVVFGNSRIAVNDVILPRGGGDDGKYPVFVSKGTLVAMHFHALHKRIDLWGPDANAFRPERWRDEIAPWVWLWGAHCTINFKIMKTDKRSRCSCHSVEVHVTASDVSIAKWVTSPCMRGLTRRGCRAICTYRSLLHRCSIDSGIFQHRKSRSTAMDRKHRSDL